MEKSRNPVMIRKRVVKKVVDGEKVTLVAKRFRVSRKFVYKWLKR
ncbi:MAG: helix-turn-helix domain-containing protein [Candidatus Heimdallarchaeaceae archaeon]